ncbi:universal stress protein [Zobellia galactanivorans]|uniref:Universal stress protein n=1 Tax=Zobellia galactanivorans (strain DSM 12802 / CCUG 47099 / CIP 106680 / NCIMB 13871 / Dsij) TaxID=63186 RepID=G0L8J6_ZOBGA|nr:MULTISPECIES: universal stress protein [Zobellia]MDO6809734.1 universal stress protein [Zobellia galactanivorans]OWW23657.1 universal stress protein UspA [Zobellia sp. OII3]CAZ97621.1 Universal stress protein [Zobellia galactanivorans]
MYKRILVPTDFSKNALNAVRYALDLYAKLNCEFYFLNVFKLENYTTDSLIMPEPGSAEYEAAKAKSEENFVRLLDMLALHHDNPKHIYHTTSTFNFLTEALKQMISEKDIDLVVMGTKGASLTKGVIFGSNTVNTMEKITECPVLAIPQDTHFSTPKEIVFSTDYKSDFKRKELSYLIEIAKMHGAAVRVLHVSKKQILTAEQEKNKVLLSHIFEQIDHSFHTLSEKKVANGITAFVESRESDMIAFINHKHFFFASIFSRPLVKEIGYDATVPILALR